MHSGTFCMHFGTFYMSLEHSACILEHSAIKVIVLLLRTKRAKMPFIYYVFDDVA